MVVYCHDKFQHSKTNIWPTKKLWRSADSERHCLASLRSRQFIFPKPVQKTDSKMKYLKRKCSQGPAIHRHLRRFFASPREHSVVIGGKSSGSSLWREKIVPRKFLSYVSFAGTSRSTIIFQSVCTETSELGLVIGDRF